MSGLVARLRTTHGVTPLSAPWRPTACAHSVTGTWRTLALFAALGACAGASACFENLSDPTPPDMSGDWHLGASVSNAASVNCAIHGDLSISQSGDQITGQVSGSVASCVSPEGDTTYLGTIDGPLTGGKILKGTTVTFSIEGCHFSDLYVFHTDPATSSGKVGCLFPYQGESATFTGVWGLTR
jgi:putative hemolysin